jgi:hypothetical protein
MSDRQDLAEFSRESVTQTMIPTAPKPLYAPGTRVRVTQNVRVGDRRWLTQIEGVVEHESRRPVGGIEMGGKAFYCLQPTLRLRREDGEYIEIAIEDDTKVDVIETPAS